MLAPPARCSRCNRETLSDWRVCPACGTPLDGATRTDYGEALSSSDTVEEGRFPAGTVLAGRYKVLGLLGRGGMDI